jgi:hypothetical protein
VPSWSREENELMEVNHERDFQRNRCGARHNRAIFREWNGRHLESLVGGLRHMAPGAGGD